MSNIYKQAIRQNLRFEFKGIRSTEDLWSLTPSELDSIFQSLNAVRKTKSEESLLSGQNQETTELDLKLEIIRDVFSTLQEERIRKQNAAAQSAQKQKLLALIADKEDESLKELSVEDLKRMAEEL